MKVVRTEEAVGLALSHDLTQIVPGRSKGARFRKGQVVRPEDIPVLLSMGKEHLYVMDVEPGMLHEEEAALRLARAAVDGATGGVIVGAPAEGKVVLKAAQRGLLRVNAERLELINAVGEITIATLRDRTPVAEGQTLAGCKVTPLFVPEEEIARAEAVGPWIAVKPYLSRKAALIVTGSEVFKGRIADQFGPVVEAKLAQYRVEVIYRALSDDRAEMTAAKIREALASGADLILCTGGMSVDPDDATPEAIRRSGAQVVTYGTPVQPGAMFMLGYFDQDQAVMGLPGAIMYDPVTVFDLVLPVVLAGERLTKQDFVRMGHGGLLK